MIDQFFREGFVGEALPDRTHDNKHVLLTHKNLIINYNGDQVDLKLQLFFFCVCVCIVLFLQLNSFFILLTDYFWLQIIHVNLTQENAQALEEGRVLEMTYSVKWVPTNISFARRFDVYLDYPFFEHQVIADTPQVFPGMCLFYLLLITWDIIGLCIFIFCSLYFEYCMRRCH